MSDTREYLCEEDLPDAELEEPIKVSSDVPEEIHNIAIADVLNSLIIDEFEAIEQYNSAIATLTSEGNNEDAIKVLNDILTEENIHIGQLQEVLKLVAPSAESIEDGKEEAQEVIDNKEGE